MEVTDTGPAPGGRGPSRSGSATSWPAGCAPPPSCFLLVGGLSRNIVYFRTVSEAVQAHEKSPDDAGRLRMAGAVVAGSVVRRPAASLSR